MDIALNCIELAPKWASKFHIHNGKTCPLGTTWHSSGYCELNTVVANCLKLNGTSCAECKTGYYLSNDKCCPKYHYWNTDKCKLMAGAGVYHHTFSTFTAASKLESYCVEADHYLAETDYCCPLATNFDSTNKVCQPTAISFCLWQLKDNGNCLKCAYTKYLS